MAATGFVKKAFIYLLAFLAMALFVSCGSSGPETETAAGTSSTTTGGASTTGAAVIKLSANPITVKSDNSNASTITATVLNSSNATVQNIVVIFSASGGQISGCTSTDNSGCSAVTDANGRAQVSFSSGVMDSSNRVATVTGIASGFSSQVPISIVGSTIELSTDKQTISNDGSITAVLTIVARDGGGTPIYNIPVSLSVSGTGKANLSQTQVTTDVNGKAQVVVTGAGAGTATVTVQGIGATAAQSYTIASVAAVFGIISPTDNPHSLTTNTILPIVVNAPGLANVDFATTLGQLTGGGSISQVIIVPVAADGTASATFQSSDAGLASIQVFDPTNPTTSVVTAVAVSAPASAAAKMTLQPSASVVAPSFGNIKNTITLTATVLTADSQVVGNTPVAFSITNPIGGGEAISPVVAYTNSSGVATTTFTSGSLSSGQSMSSINIQAIVVGTSVSAATNIVINQKAGSVAIGSGTVINPYGTAGTTYSLPMSVLVADSNGNAVSGALVSLSAWPISYFTGNWYLDGDSSPNICKIYYSGQFPNEDVNENLILDPGEDVNHDGSLTPVNSAAGTLPMTVTTDQNGVADFNLVYLKEYAGWITDRVRATTLVMGTQTTSSLEFILPVDLTEAQSCALQNAFTNGSPWYVFLNVHVGGTVTYSLPFKSQIYDSYKTSSPYSSVNSSTGLYTFNAAGLTAGNSFDDIVTIYNVNTATATITSSTVSGLWIRIFVQ